LGSFTQSYIVAPFIEHYATTEKCPRCGSPLPEGATSCPSPSCRAELGWGAVTWDGEGNLILKPSKGGRRRKGEDARRGELLGGEGGLAREARQDEAQWLIDLRYAPDSLR